MSKAPAFQFYPKDYETDEHVKLMTLEQEGVFLRLMCHQWLHASIPDETSQLALICRTSPTRMKKLWPGVAPCFPLTDDGRRANRRMARDRMDLERFRENRIEAGRAGGVAKAAKQTASSARVLPVAKTASPFSVLQSPPASPETDLTDLRLTPPPTKKTKERPVWLDQAIEAWQFAFKGKADEKLIKAHVGYLVGELGWDTVRPVWSDACCYAAASGQAKFFTERAFGAKFGSFQDEYLKRKPAAAATPAPKEYPWQKVARENAEYEAAQKAAETGK